MRTSAASHEVAAASVARPASPAGGWLAGPWPGVLAAAAALLGLGGLGFGLGAIYASVLPVPVPVPVLAVEAVVEARADSAGGMGGPADPTFPPAGGVGDLLAEAVRPVAIARELGAADLGRPVLRPVHGGWISSSFGRRRDPFTGGVAAHRGVDFAGLRNSAIVASGAGLVTWSGRRRGYGYLVEIDHGAGFVSRYGHNAANLVTTGDQVKAGQVIALMGSTGRSTGNHLHFEILENGRPINPLRLIAQR